ncbi:RNA polymerase sigma factor [Gemmatimonas sp.]|uniref:RNA polymerase sigma factor n=1 Tax=Gemmatimonas sp. TaxID=1962908 RepID=UPI003982D7A6
MTSVSGSNLALRQQRYEELVRPHLDRLLGFAARRTISFSDAEDAVQDMCVRAWSAFDELRDPARVRPWLFSILRTVLSDAFDRTSRRARLVPMSRLEDVHEQFVSTDTDVVFADVVARLDEEMLRLALDAIPEDFASAVELHDIEGFKYHEIADIVGVPIGTVMSRISRGRRLLAGVIMERRQQWALGSTDDGGRRDQRSSRGRTPRTS